MSRTCPHGLACALQKRFASSAVGNSMRVSVGALLDCVLCGNGGVGTAAWSIFVRTAPWRCCTTQKEHRNTTAKLHMRCSAPDSPSAGDTFTEPAAQAHSAEIQPRVHTEYARSIIRHRVWERVHRSWIRCSRGEERREQEQGRNKRFGMRAMMRPHLTNDTSLCSSSEKSHAALPSRA